MLLVKEFSLLLFCVEMLEKSSFMASHTQLKR